MSNSFEEVSSFEEVKKLLDKLKTSNHTMHVFNSQSVETPPILTHLFQQSRDNSIPVIWKQAYITYIQEGQQIGH